MDARATIGMMLLLGAIGLFLWFTTPRVMRDFAHGGDYVPARSHTLTDYRCTNVNFFMFNHCSATFVSAQAGERDEITDWRFGRAPRERAQLMERRDDASWVTTDVSLRTVWNRLAVVLIVLFGGLLAMISLIVKSRRADDAPGDGAAAGAAPQPAKAARFGQGGVRGFGRRHS